MFSFLDTIKSNIKNKNKVTRSSRVYLDNAGATEIGARPKAALLEALSLYGNPSGIHKEGVEAGVLFDKARRICATILNAHIYEVYFVGSGTESCNLAVMGTYEGWSRKSKVESRKYIPHIITSIIEHPAVLEPLQRLEKDGLIRVTYLPVYDNGIVKVNDVREALTEDTILISVMYANNEIGTLQPVKEIGRMLEEWKKEHGRTHTAYPYFHIDACQAGNYCNLDVVRLRTHLMTLNSSKVYGPKGIALLYKREGITLLPITQGGGQERGLRSGTENVPSAYAFAIALEEAENIKDKESTRLRILRDYCKDELQKVNEGITFYGAFDGYREKISDHRYQTTDNTNAKEKYLYNEFRLPNNINCRIPGISSEEMIIRLDNEGFAVSHKSACSSQVEDGSYVIRALGASDIEAYENIRITLGKQTTKKDIDLFVKAVSRIFLKFK